MLNSYVLENYDDMFSKLRLYELSVIKLERAISDDNVEFEEGGFQSKQEAKKEVENMKEFMRDITSELKSMSASVDGGVSKKPTTGG